MEIRYRREARHNYMLLQKTGEPAAFEEEMMKRIRTDYLLSFSLLYEADCWTYGYEISSMQPLSRISERGAVTGALLRAFVLALNHVLLILEENMISEQCLSLSADTIYVDEQQPAVRFCVIPGGSYSLTGQLSALFRMLLGEFALRSEDAVLLCHRFLQAVREENFCIGRLCRLVSENTVQEPAEARRERSRAADETANSFREEILPEKVLREKPDSETEEDHADYASYGFPERERERERETAPEGSRTETPEPEGVSRFRQLFFSRQTLLCGGILVLAPVLVFILRGQAAVFRMLPAFAVIDAGVILYALTGVYMRRERREPSDAEDLKEESGFEYGRAASPAERGIQSREREQTEYTGQEYAGEAHMGEACEERKCEEEEKEMQFWTGRIPEVTDRLAERRLVASQPGYPSFSISRFPCSLGKEAGCSDLVIKNPHVSRMHLRIDQDQSGYSVSDLNSTNGTTVAGRKLNVNETVPLLPGQEIGIAGLKYVFL